MVQNILHLWNDFTDLRFKILCNALGNTFYVRLKVLRVAVVVDACITIKWTDIYFINNWKYIFLYHRRGLNWLNDLRILHDLVKLKCDLCTIPSRKCFFKSSTKPSNNLPAECRCNLQTTQLFLEFCLAAARAQPLSSTIDESHLGRRNAQVYSGLRT